MNVYLSIICVLCEILFEISNIILSASPHYFYSIQISALSTLKLG
jgi:hypothetical protein